MHKISLRYINFKLAHKSHSCVPLWSKEVYTVKKGKWHSRPQPGCHLPNSPRAGIIKLFPLRDSLVSDIPAGDGNVSNLFYGVWPVTGLEKGNPSSSSLNQLYRTGVAKSVFGQWLGRLLCVSVTSNSCLQTRIKDEHDHQVFVFSFLFFLYDSSLHCKKPFFTVCSNKVFLVNYHS